MNRKTSNHASPPATVRRFLAVGVVCSSNRLQPVCASGSLLTVEDRHDERKLPSCGDVSGEWPLVFPQQVAKVTSRQPFWNFFSHYKRASFVLLISRSTRWLPVCSWLLGRPSVRQKFVVWLIAWWLVRDNGWISKSSENWGTQEKLICDIFSANCAVSRLVHWCSWVIHYHL